MVHFTFELFSFLSLVVLLCLGNYDWHLIQVLHKSAHCDAKVRYRCFHSPEKQVLYLLLLSKFRTAIIIDGTFFSVSTKHLDISSPSGIYVIIYAIQKNSFLLVIQLEILVTIILTYVLGHYFIIIAFYCNFCSLSTHWEP